MSFSLSVALCNTVPLEWALWNCFVWLYVKLPLVYPSKYVLILHGLCVVFSLLLNMICYLYCLDSLYLLNCVLCLIPWALSACDWSHKLSMQFPFLRRRPEQGHICILRQAWHHEDHGRSLIFNMDELEYAFGGKNPATFNINDYAVRIRKDDKRRLKMLDLLLKRVMNRILNLKKRNRHGLNRAQFIRKTCQEKIISQADQIGP